MFKRFLSVMTAIVLLATGLSVVGASSASAALEDVYMNPASTIKGATITNLGIPSSSRTDVVHGAVCLTAAQASDTSGTLSIGITSVGTGTFFPVKKIFSSLTDYNSWSSGNQTNLTASSTLVEGNVISIVIADMAMTDPPINLWYAFDVTVDSCGSGPITPDPTDEEIAAAAALVAAQAAQAAAAAAQAAAAQAASQAAAAQAASQAAAAQAASQAAQAALAASQAAAAQAARIAAAEARVAEVARQKTIAEAKSALNTVLKGDKAGTFDQYRAAGFEVANEKVASRVNIAVLKLQVADRDNFDKINSLIKVENFVNQISTPTTQKTITSSQLVSFGLLPADSTFKASILAALRSKNPSTLDTFEKIQAVINSEIAAGQARKDRFAAIAAKIAARKK